MNHKTALQHIILLSAVILTLLPFYFVLNNSIRSNNEIFRSPFAFPQALKNVLNFTFLKFTGREGDIVYQVRLADQERIRFEEKREDYGTALREQWHTMSDGFVYAWEVLRQYMVNSILVSLATALGVLTLGSITAYVFARYKFPGCQVLFYLIISVMMIPSILTLVPSVQLVTALKLRNSYWVLILPFIASGQVFAIFVLRAFFQGLPEDLFDAARIDGAGHLRLYWNVVLPLSIPPLAVILVMNILSTWNSFIWPFIVNSDQRYHVVASGLFLMSTSSIAENYSAMFAAYLVSSIPLLLLFVYATKPFIQGISTGAFKA